MRTQHKRTTSSVCVSQQIYEVAVYLCFPIGTRISQPEVAYKLYGQLYLVTKEVVYALDIKISLAYNA